MAILVVTSMSEIECNSVVFLADRVAQTVVSWDGCGGGVEKRGGIFGEDLTLNLDWETGEGVECCWRRWWWW